MKDRSVRGKNNETSPRVWVGEDANIQNLPDKRKENDHRVSTLMVKLYSATMVQKAIPARVHFRLDLSADRA